MRLLGWICIAIGTYFFFPLIQSGRDTSMYFIPFMLPLIIGFVLLKNAGAYEQKQAENKANSKKPNVTSQDTFRDRLLSGFPKSYLVLACVLLFNYQRGILSGLTVFPWGMIRSISILAIVILPAFKAFPKRNLYLGLAMIGYSLNSLRLLLVTPFSIHTSGTIVMNICTVLVFIAAGVGLISEKRRKSMNRVVVIGESLFLFVLAMSIMASVGDASDDFQEFGLTFSALMIPGLILISAGLMYGDYTCAQFPTALVPRRNALIAILVVLVLGLTPLRNVLGGGGYYSRPYSSGSGSGSSYGAGGYDMPRSGESFSDYVKRVDPGLYRDMEDRYNSLK